MTSTPFNVGLGDGSRSSSRVLRPPGGGHTDIFGGETEPPRGRRPAPSVVSQIGEPPKPTNGTNAIETPAQNGQEAPPQEQHTPEPAQESPKESPKTEAPKAAVAEPAKVDAPKRVRVPPGGFSSGLCTTHSTGCANVDADKEDCMSNQSNTTPTAGPAIDKSKSYIQDDNPANVDLRYGGQCLTPEQLPEFCDQLHHLVAVIRNIQSYAKVTGEYPSELERRLEREAREVAALAAEARNAMEVVNRTRLQRRALKDQRAFLETHLAALRETEVRELENTVRLSDRKLFKSWEVLKDSTDPASFGPLLDEIKNKQTALECLTRLVESRRSIVSRTITPPQPLPPPQRNDNEGVRKKYDGGRRSLCKRRRKDAAKEPRSVPLSGEPSLHGPQNQGTESTSRCRVGSAGAVVITPIELTSRGSYRDVVFFTVD